MLSAWGPIHVRNDSSKVIALFVPVLLLVLMRMAALRAYCGSPSSWEISSRPAKNQVKICTATMPPQAANKAISFCRRDQSANHVYVMKISPQTNTTQVVQPYHPTDQWSNLPHCEQPKSGFAASSRKLRCFWVFQKTIVVPQAGHWFRRIVFSSRDMRGMGQKRGRLEFAGRMPLQPIISGKSKNDCLAAVSFDCRFRIAAVCQKTG